MNQSLKIQAFLRKDITKSFPTYAPSTPWDIQMLKLDSGENLWCPDLQIDCNGLIEKSACYPDAHCSAIRAALAKDCDFPSEWIAVGNGSDELIDLLCRLCIEPGDRMVNFTPTFPMYEFFGKLNRSTLVDVPRNEDFSLDLEKAKRALSQSKLAFLANPNNPTGTLISRNEIADLLSVGALLVVDEAYFEFADETVIDLVKDFENLIVLRTFSKWAGIAGLRIGWMVANPLIIEKIMGIRAPYSVNSVAQSVAQEILRKKEEFLPCIREICATRDWFVSAINEILGVQAIPSRASCVTVLCKSMKATFFAEQLQAQGIVVKVLPESLIPNALRISMAPKKEMERVVEKIKKISSS